MPQIIGIGNPVDRTDGSIYENETGQNEYFFGSIGCSFYNIVLQLFLFGYHDYDKPWHQFVEYPVSGKDKGFLCAVPDGC